MAKAVPLAALYADADQLAGQVVAAERDVSEALSRLRGLRLEERRLEKDIRRAERRVGRTGPRRAVPPIIAHTR